MVMSVCATVNRPILLNITNMEELDIKTTAEKVPVGNSNGGLRDAKGAKTDQTSAASSDIRQVAQSIGSGSRDTGNRREGKNRPKSLLRCTGKIESGSGSGDQDGGQQEDGIDVVAKKRKTRRGKPKHRKLKPYSKQHLSYQQRLRCRSVGRLAKTARQIPAPYNTTQFLMDDHSDLPDFEQKLSEAASSEVLATFQKRVRSRTRDSSFSVDSDEDYFYSSPEDEEEFLTKEFSSAYEDLHAERLGTLSKSELIQEYLQLEAKVDMLTKRLRGKSMHQLEERESDSEVMKKLKVFQQRIDELIKQNEQLKRENEMLRSRRHGSPVSSMDSESDSDSTSNGNQNTSKRPRRNSGSSSGQAHYKSRQNSNEENDTSESSTESSNSSTNSSQHTNAKSTPINLTNGHLIINEMDGLPT